MNDKYAEFLLNSYREHNSNYPYHYLDNWRTEWNNKLMEQTVQTWIDSSTKELFSQPVKINNITEYFGDDKMLMKDLMFNIEHTIVCGEYSEMDGYNCKPYIYFHRTESSTLYSYIYKQFNIIKKHDKENVNITYDGYGFLEISFGCIMDIHSIPEMDFVATIENTHFNRVGISVNMTDKEDEIEKMLKDNEPLSFVVATKDEYNEFFVNREIHMFDVESYDLNNVDTLRLKFRTDLDPTGSYTYKYTFGSDSNDVGYKVESVTSINKESEISKVLLFDFKNSCDLDYTQLKDRENVVLLHFMMGEYFGFVLNPNNENKQYNWIELKTGE